MSLFPVILSQAKFIHRDSLKFPIEERALQFGDGIYEVIRVYKGNYYLLDEHIDRLYRSTEAIKIKLSQSKEELKKLLLELLERNNVTEDGKVYMQVSRGSAPRDHVFPTDVEPNVYAYVQPLARNLEALRNGVQVITHRDIRWENCFIKSLNLLPNVMAKQEAKEHGCYEAILHRNGRVTECSAANIYLVKNGTIYTHPATNNILHGCVRMAIERFVDELSIPFIEEAFTLEEITEADELFLSSSTSEVMPIVQVDGKLVQDGKPGEITRKLQAAYEKDANIIENIIANA
ncbi:D-amino-acid transaminase [Ornithinibacillus sp. BX22]|uniref:D-alanine aminotransferase n=2 Tax=Ornithinibacillus TaxID=484508 RepID=A0A923L539_9BACI|nr:MULTISPECIES: D-amino-acid transaminase [Ornithinibacillus]MBC5636550.1 D-amino-acid transaminase [Ornithinibacillus hominis]MBS3680608.1 D-amino-acid transaminase [Ornithinibacillus massiliensis]